MTSESDKPAMRPARMPLRSIVVIHKGGESWTSEIADISTSGVLVSRPFSWIGRPGEVYALDMLVDDEKDLHVEAVLVRETDIDLAFTFDRIPESSEEPLWSLLGGYADRLEPYSA